MMLEEKLKGRVCEFCNKNKATGYTHSGGSEVFHCSQCLSRLGQDRINSKLPMGSHTEEMLHLIRFREMIKEEVNRG